MAQLGHPDIYYSYRRFEAVVTATAGQGLSLVAMEALLVKAGQAHRERRYQDAISAYQQARQLIWSQLFPAGAYDETKARTADIFRPLVSYAAEWLNVLPVEQLVAGVRPRELPNFDPGPSFGLRSDAIGVAGTNAAADLELSKALTNVGNTGAAKFFRDRAVAQQPDFVKAVEAQSAPLSGVPSSTTPATIAHPSSPMVPIHPAPLAGTHPAINAIPTLAGGGPSAAFVALKPLALSPTAAILTPIVGIPEPLTVAQRTYSFELDGKRQQIAWKAGDAAASDRIVATAYDLRKALKQLPDMLLAPQRPADVAVSLAHAWYYVTPLGLAEAYHALGDWATAESWYLIAAAYQYINATVEAPFVWSRLATLYLDWGNSYFRSDDAQSALPIYERVLTVAGAAPAGPLYTLVGLKSAADAARNVIANLGNIAAITASPAISSVIFDVQSQLAKISGGLDYWGHWAANVPIWTFDYLQSVAINFCQLAIGTERDAISFWEKADLGQLTRTQLTQTLAQANAERDAAIAQVNAARSQLDAYVAGEQTARLRADDARANAQEYTQKSWEWTMHQALSSQLTGGEDGDADELNRLADRMMSGPYSIEGERGTLSAAESLAASRTQRQYEIDSLQRQADEMDAAQAQATAERQAAAARVTATEASANAAAVRVAGARELVAAFDEQRFTPDVWNAMGEKMNRLSQRYLSMALDIAKLMQRAFNFENDTAYHIIKADYSADTVRSLLAADSLMADVQTFTFDLITSTAPKSQPVRQTISLSQRYPFLFESKFRKTGRMEFQTTQDDFDLAYPGTYAGRIEHVEIAVDGIIPARGVSGTLTNAGISHYRVPNAGWGLNTTGLKHRVQSREALVLSDFDPRTDAIIMDTDRRRRRIFEGAGVASAWTLELPKELNEIDYASILDVRLTFTYAARYDPDLRARVLTALAARPQANERQRPLPLRWLFPDAFFNFYASGILAFELTQADFPAPQRSPVVTGLSLVAATTPSNRAAGLVLNVTAPGKPPVAVTTGADGAAPSGSLAAAVGGSALGPYRIELAAGQNPAWVSDGALALDAIDNLALVLGYSFTPRT